MSTSTPVFGTQLIGQTEKTMNAILDRLLAGPGLTEPQWITLVIGMRSRGTIARDQYTRQVADALKLADTDAHARIAELGAAGLLDIPADDSLPVRVTESGRRVHGGLQAATAEVTQRLWGDLDAGDLATAGRVLGIVLERANVELARH